MGFQSVPKSVTLNDLERRNDIILIYFVYLRSPLSIPMESPCEFPCVNNSNLLNPILYRFRDVSDYWSNFRCQQESTEHLFSKHSFWVNPKLMTAKFGFKKLTASLYRMVLKTIWHLELFRRCCLNFYCVA